MIKAIFVGVYGNSGKCFQQFSMRVVIVCFVWCSEFCGWWERFALRDFMRPVVDQPP
jgi:hypothetical protein